MWAYISRSTLKREFSSFVFFCWMFFGAYLMWRLPISQFAPDAALSAWAALTPFMFGLVTAAFGADFVAKQTNIAGPPANTETTVKAEVTDNVATVTTTSEQTP
jgi:hypothetical protein